MMDMKLTWQRGKAPVKGPEWHQGWDDAMWAKGQKRIGIFSLVSYPVVVVNVIVAGCEETH